MVKHRADSPLDSGSGPVAGGGTAPGTDAVPDGERDSVPVAESHFASGTDKRSRDKGGRDKGDMDNYTGPSPDTRTRINPELTHLIPLVRGDMDLMARIDQIDGVLGLVLDALLQETESAGGASLRLIHAWNSVKLARQELQRLREHAEDTETALARSAAHEADDVPKL